MDDRTIGVSTFGNNHHLQAALDYTNNFDNAVGFEVNPDKTQIWSISNPQDSQKEMEHLGLKNITPIKVLLQSRLGILKNLICVSRSFPVALDPSALGVD